MPKITCTAGRKEPTFGADGRSNYGSNHAECMLEIDVTAETMSNPQLVVDQWRTGNALALMSVNEQLAKMALLPPRTPVVGGPPGDAAEPPYDETERPIRRDTAPPANRSNAQPMTQREVDDRDYDQRDGRDEENYRAPGGGGGGQYKAVAWPPTTGKLLWGWAKENNQVKFFIELGKKQNFASQMSDWNADQVSWACRIYAGKQAVTNGNGRH